MEKPAKFFIVFSPDGPTPPVKAHASHKEACRVAWLMAKAHPGQAFYVMKSASRPCVVEAVVDEAA